MATNRATNFRGRFEYLEAIATHWLDVLRSLHGSAAEPFAACMKGSDRMPSSFSDLCRYATEHENESVIRLLAKWARDHGVSDSWLLDAAVQSLGVWCRGEYDGRWHYVAQELQTPTFRPAFDALWIPTVTKWMVQSLC